jgi:hypothetical protein
MQDGGALGMALNPFALGADRVYDRSRPRRPEQRRLNPYLPKPPPEKHPMEECDVPDELSLDPDDPTGESVEPAE